ncbi:NAD+-dependent protein deacetylase SIR2 [Geosmithia morbida]|uniref:NAD+-dependent protein deacetylase SIR2 n=1 Tax=Geosmithia morbida TaxID=1094350 RepID=A0A9P4YYB6_9HYPO|nr:NAD+-dependent protein deacetylase SIR2 [Geosmithia morbida]KAF4124029.1 NAD+-dependent protein deacetylase SIR2 [Geosmithia morbida]
MESPTREADTSSLLSSPPSSPMSALSDMSGTPSLPGLPIASSSLADLSHRYPSPTCSASTSGTQTPSKKTARPTKPTTTAAAATAAAAAKPGSSKEPKPSRPRAPPDPTEKPARPAKRPKLTAATLWPKERTTEHLDLTKPEAEWTEHDALQLERLSQSLRRKKKIVVVAGAGISVSAGIPDFRSATGLFAPAGSQQTKLKASGRHLFDASVYKHDESTHSFHTMVREMADMASRAKPTPFHHLLASLAREGRLMRLYSQNIDCIDTSMEPLATRVPLNAKGPWPTTIQLHGGLDKMVCTKCAQLQPLDGALFDGPEPPLCGACKDQDEVRTAFAGKRSHGIGRLRPRFVLYNEFNPDGEAIGNVSSADLKARPDAVIVVGTSLKVPGTRRLVKELCQVTRHRRGGFTAFINTDSEPKGAEFKDCWDMVVRAPCDMVAREVGCASWSCNIGTDYLLSAEDSLQSQIRCRATKIEVEIPCKSPSPTPAPATAAATVTTPTTNRVRRVDGMPTPRPSPKPGASKDPAAAAAAAAAAAGRPKQTRLSFAVGKEDTATKTDADRKQQQKHQQKHQQPGKKTAAVRAKGRKPLRTSQPKNTVAQAFRAVKGGAEPGSVKVAGKLAAKPEHDSADDSAVTVKSEERPSTPTTTSAYHPASQDTISPKSIPKSMADLIDVDVQ